MTYDRDTEGPATSLAEIPLLPLHEVLYANLAALAEPLQRILTDLDDHAENFFAAFGQAP